jgi:cytochrome d ubiquinol oxidase subunit I
MVCLGAHFSAVWIVVANSWMQTPAGYKIIGEGDKARAVITDFWAMVFNPSSMDRLWHTIVGCWIAGVFLVLSVGAYYYLKKKHMEFAKVCIKLGLITGLISLSLQLLSGHDSAGGVAMNQPAKLAAMEGVYQTKESTPISVAGFVDTKNQKVYSLKIPGALSFLIYNNFTTPVQGLDQIPKDQWPNVQLVFQSYHLMVMMWGIMFLITILGIYFYRKNTLQKQTWLLKLMVISVLFPQIANMTGWYTAEAGRQPWLVYGLLKTSQGVSPNITAPMVMASIVMFIIIYFFLLGLFLYIVDRKIKDGPKGIEESLVYTKNPLE